ncbi:MAG: hypothetical protein Q8R98_21680 [Rubrivivax sp.]|nr:hypothetical protein [Rubrivivax sp.]
MHDGGKLLAARIKSIFRQARPASLAATNDQSALNPDVGDEYELEWVDINDPDASPVVVTGQPGGVTLGSMAGPTFEALSKDCMRMSRGEGIWHSAGLMFIVDTAAGVDGGGRPGRGEGAVWDPCSIAHRSALPAGQLQPATTGVANSVAPASIWIVAERLAQPEGDWRAFVPEGWAGQLYRRLAGLRGRPA